MTIPTTIKLILWCNLYLGTQSVPKSLDNIDEIQEQISQFFMDSWCSVSVRPWFYDCGHWSVVKVDPCYHDQDQP